jgi:hypothetical protein
LAEFSWPVEDSRHCRPTTATFAAAYQTAAPAAYRVYIMPNEAENVS